MKSLYELHNLDFAYRDKLVLREINLQIPEGSFTSIIGPNGSGKTTLLKIISARLCPQQGRVLFKGTDLQNLDPRQLSRQLAVVTQEESIRFPFSCLEVLTMGRRPFHKRGQSLNQEDLEIIEEIIDVTDISHLIKKSITDLSGGERQRVILARALVQTPRVLLLDEAFSEMDLYYRVYCLNYLQSQVKRGELTVITVMHDLNLASIYSDYLLAMQDGRIIQAGRQEEVINVDFLQKLFGVKVRLLEEKGIVVLSELV